MASKIGDILGLSTDEQNSVEKSSGKFASLAEWFVEASEAIKETPLLKLLGEAGDAAKEWTGTIKAVAKVIEKVTKERSPEVLGWLACTLAYRRASEDAIREFGRPTSRIPYSGEIVANRLKRLHLEDSSIMKGFSLRSSAGHPLLRAADEGLIILLEAAGYDPAEQRKLLRIVRATFKSALQDLLSGEQKDKFAAFTQWLQLDTDDARLNEVLRAFADVQRAEFEDQPALGIEPFSVSDVYIDIECGHLSWKEIRDGIEGKDKTLVDPFAESSGGRNDLFLTVLELMTAPKFNDCIVIQGAPGAGKSTFTRRLCIGLQKEGLLPIRIPLQHLRVDANIFDAIQEVIINFSKVNSVSFDRNLLAEKVFGEQVDFGNSQISPYVFIFDGWDEISLSAAEGFQQRVDRLLDSIRQWFFNQNRRKVRVVITGRPSAAVGRTNFLRDDTPVLTIKPIRPEQLRNYVKSLSAALAKPAFAGEEIDKWDLGDLGRYKIVLEQYEELFPSVRSLDVLGEPLLAHLAMKVMANFKGNLSKIISPPTTLYRHLVDLTCMKAGKYPQGTTVAAKSARIEGASLRALLHGTALAITAYGAEAIPMDELAPRLETLGVGIDLFETTGRDVLDLAQRAPLSNLMISFYFKAVREQSGCEFLHKSFREYLTAEAIVEVLKRFSSLAQTDLPERPKSFYWLDFQDTDPRRWLVKKLGEILSPQWLRVEVNTHISELLKWEIQIRGNEAKDTGPLKQAAISTEPLSLNDWVRVRDGLVDLWDWWGEGVHLRPQPREQERLWKLDPPHVVELVRRAMRRSNYNRPEPPRPPRTATIDAHLGYGLFQLNCFAHFYISEARGWQQFANSRGPVGLWNEKRGKPRRYQIAIEIEKQIFIQFAPSGESREYFKNYIARINGAGVAPGARQEDIFFRIELEGILAATELPLGAIRTVPMASVSEISSKIVDSLLTKSPEVFPAAAFMKGVYLAETDLTGVCFAHAKLETSTFQKCALQRSCFDFAKLMNCHFGQADLSGSSLLTVDLSSATLRAARLEGAQINFASLREVDLDKAVLDGAVFRISDLSGASNLSQEQLNKTAAGLSSTLPKELTAPPHWKIPTRNPGSRSAAGH